MRKLLLILKDGVCWFPRRHQLAKGIHGHTVVCQRCHHTFHLTPDQEPRYSTTARALPKWRYVMEQTREELQVAWGGFPAN